MNTRTGLATCAALGALIALACGGGPDPDPADADPSPHAPAGAEAAGALPEGHPTVPDQGTPLSDIMPTIPDGAGEGSMGLAWTAPDTWVSEPPASSMRRAQWRLGEAEEPATCAVFYFGPGQGGDAMANAHRWASQFTLPDGRAGTEGVILDRVDAEGLPIVTVEVTGTFNPGMPFAARPSEERPDQMLLGAIVEGPDANWFVKCTGPEAVLGQHRESFSAFLSSFRAAPSTKAVQ